MIIHSSMRTDIPAFYAEWLSNRLRAGFVRVRNPYDLHSVTQYSLSPKVVDLIAFCTKAPAGMFPYMELLRPYGQYWFVTITPYGRVIEPRVPPKEAVMRDLRYLSDLVGVDSVGWRYDPIFISADYPVERHIRDFEEMAATLCGSTRTCVISFIDLYQKVKRNFPEAREVNAAERLRLGRAFAEIGGKYGMTVKACAEGDELAPCGVDCGGCMTVSVLETALHTRLRVPKKKPARSECACVLGNDIGMYDTCGHLCRYCYANSSAAAVRQNLRRHDPTSPFLIGGDLPGDEVHIARQESWIDGQLRLDI